MDDEFFRLLFSNILGGFISILTTILILYFKKIGKLVLISNNSRLILKKRNSYNEEIEVDDIEQADICEFSIDISVFNSSEVPKVISNLSLELINNKQSVIFEPKIFNRSASGNPFSVKVNPINILPQQSSTIVCKSFIEELSLLLPNFSLYLKGKKSNRRIIKFLLFKNNKQII